MNPSSTARLAPMVQAPSVVAHGDHRGRPSPIRVARAIRSRGMAALGQLSVRESAAALVLLLPALLVIGMFVLYPIIDVGYLSLTSWDGYSPVMHWVGLSNYLQLTHDPYFRTSLFVTLIYAGTVSFLGVLSGLGIALLLNAPLRGRTFYRGIYFLPLVSSSIGAAVLWQYVFGLGGPVNKALGLVHLSAQNWLGSPHLALACLVLLTVWKSLGLNVVLYLTALQTLPTELYEAADVDGATSWQKTHRLTFPLVSPMTAVVVIQAIITTFQSFDLIYALTAGGPLNATTTIGYYTYQQAFQLGKFGYGSAVAFAGFAMAMGLTLMQWRLGGGRMILGAK